ncbi:MAG TPA: tetratricopeptide repeat protein [Chloroflexota bacterium]|nr:tetratricopeptide repeat protein [Chloroflexota bacterium]
MFTDIEGSTRLLEQQPAAYRAALQRHHAILSETIQGQNGFVFETVGDAIYAAFSRPSCAVSAAAEAQRALIKEPWEGIGQLRVRMGIHVGEGESWGEHYFGSALYRCARLTALAHGGQVVLSSSAADLAWEHLPAGATLLDLGEQPLKDIVRPERVFQLCHPDLPADFPPLRTLRDRPNNLLAQNTPFIGRQREVDQIRHEMLRRQDVRLLTLIGPCGTGKTRLALQVALDSLDDFPDGVFFVALGRVANPDLVASTVAQTLGVRERGDRTLKESLVAHLTGRRLLLVLDNFEHIAEAAPLVSDLLATCPSLKVLATSRAALRVYGEHEFLVPTMKLPGEEILGALSASITGEEAQRFVDQLLQFEAIRLFVERAQSISPTFSFSASNAGAIAEICVRLDGLPLAIELAAARTRLLSPQAILDRLENRLPLLVGGARDLPARQQTLRGAVSWSYDLLTPAERALFRRLAVFTGGCTLEAAEEVLGGDRRSWSSKDASKDETGASDEESQDAGVMEGLEALVAQSLLRQEYGRTDSANGKDEAPRFVMLQTIRDFALEQLRLAGECDRAGRRHADYFLALAERASPELRGPRQAWWLSHLHAERHNLRAALRWFVEQGEADCGLRLGASLWLFWHLHGYLSEGREWLTSLLALPSAETSTAVRARALTGFGVLTAYQGEYATARRFLEESVALSRSFLPGGNSTRDLASALAWLGHVVQRDEPDMAHSLLDESLALARELNDRALIARVLNNLGEVARRAGHYDRAAALYGEALTQARALGHQSRIGSVLHNLGHVARHRGDLTRAVQYFEEGLGIVRALGFHAGVAHCLAGLAAVAADLGEAERAARLFGVADALLESICSTLVPADQDEYDRSVAATRAQLDDVTFITAWSAARRMPLERAIAYALHEEATAILTLPS